MPKIIKRVTKEATCRNCGATMEYHNNEVKQMQIYINEVRNYIECPACKHNVEV